MLRVEHERTYLVWPPWTVTTSDWTEVKNEVQEYISLAKRNGDPFHCVSFVDGAAGNGIVVLDYNLLCVRKSPWPRDSLLTLELNLRILPGIAPHETLPMYASVRYLERNCFPRGRTYTCSVTAENAFSAGCCVYWLFDCKTPPKKDGKVDVRIREFASCFGFTLELISRPSEDIINESLPWFGPKKGELVWFRVIGGESTHGFHLSRLAYVSLTLKKEWSSLMRAHLVAVIEGAPNVRGKWDVH